MLSYNCWSIDCTVTSQTIIQNIIGTGRLLDPTTKGAPTWDKFAFRTLSGKTNWNPSELLLALSREYSNVMFSASYRGESGTGKIFFYNGDKIEASEIWINPPFPSTSLFKKSVAAKKKRDSMAKAEYERLATIETESANQARIKALEEELRRLKERKVPLAPMDISPQRQ